MRNLHPEGGEIGLGISPVSGAATSGRSGSGCGIEARSACVYGWRGSRKTRSVGPVSTILPRYITAMRWLMCSTTERSCATNRTVALQRGKQV